MYASWKAEKNFHDGEYWTYNSASGYSEYYGYMSVDSVKRNIRKLTEAGLIKRGCFNELAWDRTSWFTLTDEGWEIFKKTNNRPIDNRSFHSANTTDDIERNRTDNTNILNNISLNILSCSEQSSPHDIPLAGGGYYNVPVQDIGDYKVAYPSADVDHELRKMKVWCESNPAKLKTRKGIKRFINAWLAKADDLAKEKKPKPVNTDFSDWSR